MKTRGIRKKNKNTANLRHSMSRCNCSLKEYYGRTTAQKCLAECKTREIR